MNAHTVLRLLDTFFRRFWLYLVPILIVGAVGATVAVSADESFESVATMRVEPDARVSQLTGTQSDPGYGWETPAAATARTMNSLIGTRTFMDDVIERGGLQENIDAGLVTPDEIRRSIVVYGDGSQLVKIVGFHRFPDVAKGVAGATIEAYTEAVMANEISDNVVAIEFLSDKMTDYEDAVNQAEDRLATWIDDHPEPRGDSSRPTVEIVQLARLQDAIANEDFRLVDLESSLQQAELAVEQKGAEVRQRFAVIDPPELPSAPLPTLKKSVLTIVMALVVGSMLAFTAVVTTAVLDRTIRHPGDVSDRLGMHHTRVLAVLPHVDTETRRRRKRARADDQGGVPLDRVSRDRPIATPLGFDASDDRTAPRHRQRGGSTDAARERSGAATERVT